MDEIDKVHHSFSLKGASVDKKRVLRCSKPILSNIQSLNLVGGWTTQLKNMQPSKWVHFAGWKFQTYLSSHHHVGVSKNTGTSKWMVKKMENPMNKWDDLGGKKTPYFWKHHHHVNNLFSSPRPESFLLLASVEACPLPSPHVSATGVTRSHPKINLEISKTSRFTRLRSKKNNDS